MSDSQDARLANDAMNMAVGQRKSRNVIHHSDSHTIGASSRVV
ncbi:hypothetical protein SAMN05428979_3023 [Stappia sp. ES.058]|nr:hypothetical protein SAMN05428979_3023 [Stappia sp. ES.058]